MEETIYIDTNVYLDYIWRRKDSIRDLYEFAFQLFRRALNGEFKIVISDWLLYELKKAIKKEIDTERLNRLITDLKDKGRIITVSKSKDDWKKAKEISPEHPDDALHAILAKKANAVCVITRNLSHYADASSIIDVKCPENI